MAGIVYDTGALLAAERRNAELWSLHQQALTEGRTPVVPVVVLAQAWRGGPQAQISRLLRGCHIQPDTEPLGRIAGVACALAGTSDVVDALVVATAAAVGDALVVTSDPDDLRLLASTLGTTLTLYPI